MRSLAATLVAALLLSAPATPATARPRSAYGFADWHLPLPAGQWAISRGPCGSGGLFTHQCGYYEDHCAIDLTPLDDSMLSVPVLAPQAGQVFFLGTRADSGLVVMLQHADGRVSAMMHLSRAVVGLDQRVAQGQVIAYAGNSGSSTRPHLHFDVQPNAVERDCLPLAGLDEIDLVHFTATSRNLAWTALTLVDPPEQLPGFLPLTAASGQAAVLPARVVVAPSAQLSLPVAVANRLMAGARLYFDGQALRARRVSGDYSLLTLALTAPAQSGDYQHAIDRRGVYGGAAAPAARLSFSVRPPADTSGSAGVVLINPTFGSPANYAEVPAAPRLCWSEPTAAGPPPLSFRVMVVGAAPADSGWVAETCWQAPRLPPGRYYWKVFVRDGQGHMNRTNQRPFAFSIK